MPRSQSSLTNQTEAVDTPVPFGSILCAVDGTRSATHAVRQAVELAGPGSRLTFLAVAYRVGAGPTEMAALHPDRAAEALTQATALATQRGRTCATEVVEERDPRAAILERAARADLLVLGAPVGPRHAGILLGSTSSAMAHRSPVPVLLARAVPEGVTFAQQILVATDGLEGSTVLVELAAGIAGPDASVNLVHVPDDDPDPVRERLNGQVALLRQRGGGEPVMHAEFRSVPDVILDAAKRDTSSLIVVGSRERSGIAALGSVSERIAHRARCSVLIVRGRLPEHLRAA